MNYYIPINKTVIECLEDVWLKFRAYTYEKYDTIELMAVGGINSRHCFLVIQRSNGSKPIFSKRYTTYWEAYRRFKNKKAKKIRDDIRHTRRN